MQSVNIVVETDDDWSVRTQQIADMFDLKKETSGEKWNFDVSFPDDWSVGLIVGASGSGKSTVSNHLFGGEDKIENWPRKGSVIDGFDDEISIKSVCSALSSVGFSSPPAWLRPFHVLSNGEKFRANMARLLLKDKNLILVDEFTSVVDRTVAKISSAAISKAVRRANKKFVAVSCHSDIIDWLQPDWVMHMPSGRIERRLVRRRPEIKLKISKVDRSEWRKFSRYHYLSHTISNAASCFVATWENVPVAFHSVVHFAHPTASAWKGHRLVCFPDFQGVGIGNKLEEFIASLYICKKRYNSISSHPAMISYRHSSKNWHMYRRPSLATKEGRHSRIRSSSKSRLTAGFEFIGKPNHEAARKLSII